MRRFMTLALLSVVSVFVYAQDIETRSIGSFKGIKSAEAVDVYLKKGDKESIRVEASGTSASNVITEVSGSYLKIHMRDGNYRNKNVKVYVTYVSLDRISASSASNVFSEGTINSSSLDLSASSAASIEININSDMVTVDVSSAGDIILEGKVKTLEVEASSAGEVDAYGLDSEKAYANASSAGSIKITVANDLNAKASSGGSIRYRGSPARTNTDSSSGGSVKKSN
jgi:hypothetical protein